MATIVAKLQNGNVLIDNGSEIYSYNPDMQVVKRPEQFGCLIRSKHGSQQDLLRTADITKVVRRDGTEIIISNDLDLLFFELTNFFFFKINSGGSAHLGTFTNYTDLVTQYPTASVGDLAYVSNSQGTWWLPGTMGGTFYSKGDYQWNGTFWDSSVDEIAAQLEEDRNDIQSLQTNLFNHVTDLANPHDTKISNLIDVDLTGPNDEDVLVYNLGLDKWENKPNNGDKNFVFTQAVASTLWTINHNLGKKPSVTVLDNLGREMGTAITHIDNNNLTSESNSAISGTAHLN
jgi:hypothetical protein